MTESDIVTTTETEEDTYHTPAVLDQISSQAKILAWAFAVIGVAILGANLVLEFRAMAQSGILSNMPSLLNALFVPLVCGFFYILLRAISEGIFVFMDIEDNTHPAKK
jgi:hypothetical protein